MRPRWLQTPPAWGMRMARLAWSASLHVLFALAGACAALALFVFVGWLVLLRGLDTPVGPPLAARLLIAAAATGAAGALALVLGRRWLR